MKFKKPMAALVNSLLQGKTITIKNGFEDYGITNVPREISRAVEQKFGVRVNRKRREYTTVYGFYQTYFEYKLEKDKQPEDSIKKMKEYVKKYTVQDTHPDFVQHKLL